MKLVLFLIITAFLFGSTIPQIYAETVPDWVKNTAGWWADDAISESEFIRGIEFLIKEDIIQVKVFETSSNSETVPDWVKNTAGWWADEQIPDSAFIDGIEFLIKTGVIVIKSNYTAEQIATLWINEKIDDNEFFTMLKNSKQTKYFVSSENSEIPDWLLNNAGWVSARILTNSEFLNFNTEYLDEKVSKCTNCIENINSQGFRGDEISDKKSQNTYRIFAVGGSTTYGTGVNDDETWPAYLQKKFDELSIGKNIEIINAGIQGANSNVETKMIKSKILKLEPDLILMYDGVNDSRIIDGQNVLETIGNWKEVCDLGNKNGFDVIITVQPTANISQRVPSDQEFINYLTYTNEDLQKIDTLETFEKIDEYPNHFAELTECTNVADLRGIFDYTPSAIFMDTTHPVSIGNKIIAKHMFNQIIQFSSDDEFSSVKIETSNYEKYSESLEPKIYAVNTDLSNKSLKNLNLKGAILFGANLENADLEGANLEGADLRNTNLKDAKIKNTNLKDAKIFNANFENQDLSNNSISELNFRFVDLSKAKISDIDISNLDLAYSNLSNQDFSKNIITNTIFDGANLTNTKFSTKGLSDKEFKATTFNEVDFSMMTIESSMFTSTQIRNANFESADLQFVTFNDVDFTDIRNKSLENANLVGSAFTYSDLSGVKLPKNLKGNNFYHSNFNDVDFSNTIIDSGIFYEAKLKNTNFKNADLSARSEVDKLPINQYGYLLGMSFQELINTILPEPVSRLFVLIENISENENNVEISFLYFNNFSYANLEGANFEGANLWYSTFFNADLKNANFKNADLKQVFFHNANLEGANFEGANLDGANLDGANLDGANMSCIGHPKCI